MAPKRSDLNGKPELLAPAGSPESLRAALAAGADAVYFGGTSFSNRMRAKNFTDDALSDAIRLCHDAGARAHITVNTRVRDREMDAVLSLCDRLLGNPETAADAIICADFGVARAIRARFPEAVLHASTQTSLSAPSDCLELRKLGFSRLVVPRELSEAEITALCAEGKKAGFEIEMFLHGAHCVSLSGQCLLSFVMGGRSGNRGECAQPCRLPFTVSDEGGLIQKSATDTPLSLADLCLAGRIPALLRTGVCSLKLEGRLKPPEYVYGVTSIYRRLLDEGRNAEKSELRALEELFTRGFTDGYFAGRYASLGATTLPTLPTLPKLPKREFPDISGEIKRKLRERLVERTAASEEAARLPICGQFRLKAGEPMRLVLSCGEAVAAAEGEVPASAEGGSTNEEAAYRSLAKLGGTPFRLEGLRCEVDEGLWVPVSALNALRRTAVGQLEAAIKATNEKQAEERTIFEAPVIQSSDRCIAEPPESAHRGEPIFTAEFAGTAEAAALCESLTSDEAAEFFGFFGRVYVPTDGIASLARFFTGSGIGCELGGVLPPLTPSDDAVRRVLGEMKSAGAVRVLCHTPGQLRLAAEAGLCGDLSFRGNITNTAALSVWRSTGLCGSITLSPELPEGALRALGGHDSDAGALVYGKLPLMVLSRCVLCGGKCARGNAGGRREDAKPHDCRGSLTDRRAERFPIISLPDCESLIVNSVPLWMGDRLSALRPLSFLHFFFTDESPAAALRAVRAYRNGEAGVGRRL